MVITIWLSIIECEKKGIKQELILALGDNTSAVACLTKTSGLDQDCVSYAAAKFIAQKLASLIWESGNFLDGKYMTDVDNTVADWQRDAPAGGKVPFIQYCNYIRTVRNIRYLSCKLDSMPFKAFLKNSLKHRPSSQLLTFQARNRIRPNFIKT